MNLFEEWDATEKRTQASQNSSSRTRSSIQQQQQSAQFRLQPPGPGDGVPGQDKQVQKRQKESLGSVWGQRIPPSPSVPPASASSSQSSSAAGASTTRPSPSPGTNPFATAPSSNPFASSNPFGTNPFGSNHGTTGALSRAGASSTLRPRAPTIPVGRSDGTAFGDPPHATNLPPTKRGDPPIFSLQRLDLDTAGSSRGGGSFRGAPPSWSILTVAVGNGTLAMATSECSVIRWNVGRDGEPEEVEISKRPEDTIHKIFLDPTGNHLLACLHGGETYYLHSSSPRPKRLMKWSGVVVEAVAFDAQRCNEANTRGIVVGTRSGDLYECSLESNGKERAFSLVYSLGSRQQGSGGAGGSGGGVLGGAGGIGMGRDVGDGGLGAAGGGRDGSGIGGSSGGVVAALHLESMSAAVHGETHVFVMAVTANPLRLHIFMGGPTLEIMFRDHRESSSTSFRELPGSMLGPELHVYRKLSSDSSSSGRLADGGSKGFEGGTGAARERAGGVGLYGQKGSSTQSFAVLTSMGIYHGSLAVGSKATPDTVIAEAQLLPYPEREGINGSDLSGTRRGRGAVGGGASMPLSMAMTEFHFVLLFTDRLQVVSRLNGAVVQEESLETQDPMTGHVLTLLTDPSTGSRGAMQVASPGVGIGNRLWLFTDRLPFKIRVSHEDRDVWMLFLEKALAGEEAHFESAAQYCKNATERAQVHYVQAGWYFRHGQHTLAARFYAKTPCCFEEIALKFMECDEGWKATALKTYLLERLRHLSLRQGEQKMQRTMLCTWLTELYLRGFTYLQLDLGTEYDREEAEFSLAEELRCFLRGHATALDPPTTMALLSSHGRSAEALFYATLVEDYDRVLAHHANNGPDYKAALDVLRKAPFDKVEPLVYKYSVSLMAADPAGTIETWMSKPQLKPTKLIPALVRYSQRRRAAMLHSSTVPAGSGAASRLPAVDTAVFSSVAAAAATAAAGEGEDLAIKYLEFCVNELKLKDAAIHNHLLALYAQDEEWRERAAASAAAAATSLAPVSSLESPWGAEAGTAAAGIAGVAVKPLEGQDDAGHLGDVKRSSGMMGSAVGVDSGKVLGLSSPGAARPLSSTAGVSTHSSALLAFINRPREKHFFDPMYALRLCSQHGRSLACVHLYSNMGLWEEAVDLALTVDTDLAKANASKPPDAETQKLLWLKIARREVERCRSADIEETMRVLQECKLLKIEDILPFFPDFVVIDSFKREICGSLEDYNTKIENLRKEMEDYTLSTEAVQAEIMELKQRSMYVSANQTCELCGRNILSTQFYVFPCGHAFHAECLMNHIRPHLSAEQQTAVTALLEEINAAEGRSRAGNGSAAKKSPAVTQSGRGMSSAGRAAGSSDAGLGSGLGLSSDGGVANGVDGSKRAQHYLRALQTELDGYVAAECVLCGDIMVQSIDKPLVTPEEQAEQAEQWAL